MEQLIAAYERRLGADRPRGWNLAQAMFMLLGSFGPGLVSDTPPPYRSPSRAVRLYLDEVLPIGRQLADRLLLEDACNVERRALALRNADDILLCAAIVNYLQKGDPILGSSCSKLLGLCWAAAVDDITTSVALDALGERVVFVTRAGSVGSCDLAGRDPAFSACPTARVAAVAVDGVSHVLCWADGGHVLSRHHDGIGCIVHSGGASITALSLSAKGRALIGDSDGQVWITDVSDPGKSRVLAKHPSQVVAVSIADDGRAFAVAWADGRVQVGRGSKASRDVQSPAGTRVTALGLSDTHRLALATRNGKLRIVDLAADAPPLEWHCDWGPPVSLSWDNEARLLAIGTDTTVMTWDTVRWATDLDQPQRQGDKDPKERHDWIRRARHHLLEQLRICLERDNRFAALSAGSPRKALAAVGSRIARDSMLFAAATANKYANSSGSLSQANAEDHKKQRPPMESETWDSLVRGPNLAFIADFKHIADQQGWPVNGARTDQRATSSSHQEFAPFDSDGCDGVDDGANQDLPDLVSLYDEGGNPHDGSLDGHEGPVVATAALEQTDEAEIVDAPSKAARDPRRDGIPVSLRPHVRAYEPLLKQVALACEQSKDVVRCGEAVASAAEFFRLRFAAQAKSYLDERSFRASQRSQLVDALKSTFKLERDPLTGNALLALASVTGNERWGASHARILKALVDAQVAPRDELRDQLDSAKASLRAFRDDPRFPMMQGLPDLDSSEGCVKALCAAIDASASIPTATPGPAPAVAKLHLEALEASLYALLVPLPQATLASFVGELDEVQQNLSARSGDRLKANWIRELRTLVVKRQLPESLTRGVDKPTRVDRSDDVDFVTRLQVLRDWALSELEEYCRSHRIEGLDQLRRAERRYSCLLTALDQLVDEWGRVREMLGQRDQGDQIVGFFTQLYSASQVPGSRTWAPEEWEYLAYRVAFTGGPPVYAQLYERVAATSDPPSARSLTALYRFLRERTSIEKVLYEAFDRCTCVSTRHLS